MTGFDRGGLEEAEEDELGEKTFGETDLTVVVLFTDLLGDHTSNDLETGATVTVGTVYEGERERGLILDEVEEVGEREEDGDKGFELSFPPTGGAEKGKGGGDSLPDPDD